MNPQQIPGHAPQSYLQPHNSGKFTKGESPSYVNTPAGRQGCPQTSPRVGGRSVAAVVPMNAKPHPMDMPPDLGPDGYNQGQMMPPGHPQSMQNFQRGPIGPPPQLNPQNLPPYASAPTGPVMMGGSGRGSMQQQQPFNPLSNQVPQEVMMQQQQQHHQQQRFPSPQQQQQQQQQHQTLPGGPRFQQNYPMDSMPPQMLPPDPNDAMEFRVNSGGGGGGGMMSPGLAPPGYEAGFGGGSKPPPPPVGGASAPRMGGARMPTDINVGVQPQFMPPSQSQGGMPPNSTAAAAADNSAGSMAGGRYSLGDMTVGVQPQFMPPQSQGGMPPNSTAAAADNSAGSMVGGRYSLGGSEALSSAQSANMCAPPPGPGASRVSAAPPPQSSQPPRATPSKPTTTGSGGGLRDSLPAAAAAAAAPPPPSFPLPVVPGTVCAACRREMLPGGQEKSLAENPGNRQQQQQQQLHQEQQLPIQCEAGCREWFHLACSGLTPEAFFLLKGEPLAEWLCNNCAALAYPNIPYIRLRQ